MTEHTPGPWFVVQHQEAWSIQNKEGGLGTMIALQYGESSVSNAKLIAAAPDLLAAAKDALALVSILPAGENEFQVTAVYEDLRAAIALTEGKS